MPQGDQDEGRRPRTDPTPPPEALFRLLVESVTDYAVFALDAQGCVTTWNAGAQRLKGYRADEILGQHLSRFYPSDKPRVDIDQELVVAARDGKFHEEGWRVRKDGTRFWADVTIMPMRDETGAILGFAKVTRDMTARKDAEEQRLQLVEARVARTAAEEASWRLAAVVEVSRSLAEAGLDFNKVGRVVVDRIGELVGELAVMRILREGELVPAAIYHRDAETRQFLEKELAAAPLDRGSVVHEALRTKTSILQTGPDLARDTALRQPGYQRVFDRLPPWSILAVPMLMPGGEAVGVLSLARSRNQQPYSEDDKLFIESLAFRAALALSQAKLYRELHEALTEVTEISRLKDEFVATLSHELRTPLNAIVGWSQLLKMGGMDEERTQKAIETIDRNAGLQTRLIADILDMSRIITGKIRLSLAPIHTEKVVEQALDAIRPAAEAKGVAIEAVLDPSAGPITGDAERLQQILWNLLSNAVKFVPRGSRVQVRLAAVNSHVELVVADNGPGIDPAFLPHVFDRFRQGDSSSTRSHGGLGLGLAIVKHLVELHGGEVRAANREGGSGAVFTVSLPRSTARPADGAVPTRGGPGAVSLPTSGARALSGIRVMLVDDEEDAREVLGAALEESGAEVIKVSSAGAVLESLARLRPHVLLADIEMPSMDGYLLLDAVRARTPGEGGLTPAIAITAYARTEDRIRALAAGFDLHIAKPVQLDELRVAVARLAGTRRQPTE